MNEDAVRMGIGYSKALFVSLEGLSLREAYEVVDAFAEYYVNVHKRMDSDD